MNWFTLSVRAVLAEEVVNFKSVTCEREAGSIFLVKVVSTENVACAHAPASGPDKMPSAMVKRDASGKQRRSFPRIVLLPS
jgi:hypothetical protein